MPRSRLPETTLEKRISRVLSSIAPLTAGQIARAVHPAAKEVVYVTLSRLHRHGVIRRVSCSPAQRHLNGGKSGAYILAAR